MPLKPTSMSSDPYISVVVPLYDEEPNVPRLVESVQAALRDRDWELLLVDDGSEDGTAAEAFAAAEDDARVRAIRLARNYGQAVAMQVGFERAGGHVIVSLDGDLQNDPRDIPRLLDRIEQGYDLVAGRRANRKDAFFTRTLPSRVANALIRRVTGTPLRDNGCSLRAYRSELLERMHLYSGMHRFVAPLAGGMAGARVDEVDVRHHPRRHGESKYGLARTWKVLADLVTVKALRSFGEHPLLLFSVLALGLIGAGAAFGATSVSVLLAGPSPFVASSFVLPTAGLLCLEVAVFLMMLGLVAEVVIRGRWNRAPLRSPVAREWGDAI